MTKEPTRTDHDSDSLVTDYPLRQSGADPVWREPIDRVSLARRARRALGRVRRLVLRKILRRQPGRRTEVLKSADAFKAPEPNPALSSVHAAVAGGERLRAGLAWEWSQVHFDQRSWRSALRAGHFDLILLEMVGGNVSGWKDDNALDGVLAWGCGNRVPIIAWVTGDADDPDAAAPWIDCVHRVFLSSDLSLDKWRARWPGVGVEVLLPAAQPKLCSPLTGGAARHRPPAAAVLYYGPSPAEEALSEFDATMLDVWPVSAAMGASLERSALRSSAMYGKTLPPASPVLSRYRVFAELGPSASSAPWEVLEAGLAHTAVVLEASALARIPSDLHELVAVAEDPAEVTLDIAARVWQAELCDREAIRLARAINLRHTFSRRVDDILGVVGVPVTRPSRAVSAVVPTNRLHQIDNVLANISRQAHARNGGLELVLVAHGLDVRTSELKVRAKDAGVETVTVIKADGSMPLGACINLGVDAASGDYVAKMDDDNFYGRHYLTDLVTAFDYTDAAIVGKWAHYVWLRSTGAVVLRAPSAEHQFERLVQGGSMLFRADIVRDLRFDDHLPRGVDTDILNRAQQAGVKTYSADRFNYVSVRGEDRHAHTWSIADTMLMNRGGTLVFYGDPRQHVDI
jgi:Glycosyl transferase family 2